MRRMVNIYEAKTHLSELVDQAAGGNEVVIAKAGKPKARLVAIAPGPRRFGLWKGKIQIGRDFDAPLPAEVVAGFEGKQR